MHALTVFFFLSRQLNRIAPLLALGFAATHRAMVSGVHDFWGCTFGAKSALPLDYPAELRELLTRHASLHRPGFGDALGLDDSQEREERGEPDADATLPTHSPTLDAFRFRERRARTRHATRRRVSPPGERRTADQHARKGAPEARALA